MKVTGFTFIRNAIANDYPVREAILSVLPLCDDFVVALGNSTDATSELIILLICTNIVLLMNTHLSLLGEIKQGNYKVLARVLTLVENDIKPAGLILRDLDSRAEVPVIGITGPPGAGKSTLVNTITNYFSAKDKRIAILAIDPTSPFNYGSLLGDRIRMAAQFNKPNVFIRSLATRGALGGISAKTIEMVDVLKASNFDLIF